MDIDDKIELLSTCICLIMIVLVVITLFCIFFHIGRDAEAQFVRWLFSVSASLILGIVFCMIAFDIKIFENIAKKILRKEIIWDKIKENDHV